MSDDRIDFSSLDPMADPARLERAVRAVLAGVTEAPAHPFLLTFLWLGRRAMLAAFAAAVAVWVLSSLTQPQEDSTDREPAPDAVAQISAWAEAGSIPRGMDVLQVVGVADAR